MQARSKANMTISATFLTGEGAPPSPLTPGRHHPATSSHLVRARRTAVPLRAVQAASGDVALLARATVVQEREDSEALSAAIEAKLQAVRGESGGGGQGGGEW